jgi:hypothetical protein
MTAVEVDGRLRLCPYYFVVAGQTRLSGALATFCPPDKKSSTACKTAPCCRVGWFKRNRAARFLALLVPETHKLGIEGCLSWMDASSLHL